MKIKILILQISFFLIGNQVISSQTKTGDLPVIDFSKQYQKKEIRLQDIADSEYIPLETTDDVLLGDWAVISYTSDKFIFIHEFRKGDMFIFNRNGKIYAHFNHKGGSGQEYPYISEAGTIFDEKNNEIFVCANSIQVYSLTGEHKRTLKINTDRKKVYNFDNESLLVYDDPIVDPGMESKTKKKPYSLISKKDGSLLSVLDIYLPQRYSNRLFKTQNNKTSGVVIYYPYSMHYGQDFAIADISSDTLYLLTQSKKLTPVLTRKPSVHASEPRNVWSTHLTTDKFILLGTTLLDFNSKGGKIPILMYELTTGNINRVSFSDTEFGMKGWGIDASPPATKNRTAELYQASSILNAYNKGQLKGKVDKFVKTLKEDDNPVVRIITFK